MNKKFTVNLNKVLTPGFYAAFKNLSTISFPILKDNIALARSVKTLDETIDGYAKARLALLNEYGTPNQEGMYTILPEKAEELHKMMAELTNVEIELSLDHKLKLPPNSTISGMELIHLWEFLLDLEDVGN